VLFTDIVGSTERAAELGDRKWADTLAKHNELAKREIGRFRGRAVKSTGDGVLATFDGPGRAIRCAQAISSGVNDLGIKVRAGLHTGECELLGADIGGIAVHIAARGPYWPEPTRYCVEHGQGPLLIRIEFEERGSRALEGRRTNGASSPFAARQEGNDGELTLGAP
jgi:hypothetical protein